MTDQVDIVVRLREAAQASRDARLVESGIKGIGDAATTASRKAAALGPAVNRGVSAAERGFGRLARSMRTPALAIGALGAAGATWGLAFNAQIESSRLRFKLFTDDVDGLMRDVQRIDMSSAFDLTDLTESAAQLGNAGVKDIASTLQGAVNAAAAGGKGAAGLQSIIIALSQIQSKGRLSQEEINQLNEAGAPGAQKTIQRAFNLTRDEIGNLGAQGLSSKKALRALTEEWTSGRMAAAAKAQTKTLGGQWDLIMGNAQKASGALTAGLAAGLGQDVLPAANRALTGITRIFENDNLAPQEKLRRARDVIERELGPIAEDLVDKIRDADLPEKLGDAVEKALPFLVKSATKIAPEVAEAFVGAWLESGPIAQLGTLLYGGKKAADAVGNLKDQFSEAKSIFNAVKGVGKETKPIPVWVVNPGFLGAGRGPAPIPPPTGPGRTPLGSSRITARGAGVGAATAIGVGLAVNALPISDEAKGFFNGPSEQSTQDQFDADMAARFGTSHRRGLIGQVALNTGADSAHNLVGAVQQAVARQPFEVNTRHTTILKVEQRELARSVEQWWNRQTGRKG